MCTPFLLFAQRLLSGHCGRSHNALAVVINQVCDTFRMDANLGRSILPYLKLFTTKGADKNQVCTGGTRMHNVSWGEPDPHNIKGYTALMFASYHGNVAVARLLVEAGANLNAVSTQRGDTALHIAAGGGPYCLMSSLYRPRSFDLLVRLLVMNGADRSIRNTNGGKVAWDLACTQATQMHLVCGDTQVTDDDIWMGLALGDVHNVSLVPLVGILGMRRYEGTSE